VLRLNVNLQHSKATVPNKQNLSLPWLLFCTNKIAFSRLRKTSLISKVLVVCCATLRYAIFPLGKYTTLYCRNSIFC
jgi:hypothetical protein